MRNWLWPVLLFVTVILCLAGMLPLTSGLAGFRADLAHRPVPLVRPASGPLARSVYLVVIDGLRYDTSQSAAMPFLQRLKKRAAWGRALAGLPSYSRPGYARILTGAPSELTGLVMNEQSEPCPVPTVFSLAREDGLVTAASAHYWVRQLADGPISGARSGRIAGRNIGHGYYYLEDDPDTRVFAAATEFIRIGSPNLLLVLPMSMDEAGHAHGGGSAVYRRSASAVDAILEDFFRSLPGDDYLAIITADHGHRKTGGHGGRERSALEVPFLAFGRGVKPGRLDGVIDQLDIAPSIAAALGLPMAGTMGGRVLTEIFAREDAARAAQEALAKAQAAYLEANADILGRHARAQDARFDRVWRGARRAALWRKALWRLPIAIPLLAGAILACLAAVRAMRRRWPILAGLAYPLYFYALFRLVGYDYSYSAIVSAGDFVVKAVFAAVLALAILTWAGAALRGGKEPFFLPTALGACIIQVVLTLAAWVVAGTAYRNFLPHLGWQVFFMIQLLITALVAVYALAGWAIVGLFRRRAGIQTGHAVGAS
ncbi:MAG: alkaline phosphatase family protein [Patescibacteria group bacterium]